jgi:predicted enzyme related to lactoylglutathione lyase
MKQKSIEVLIPPDGKVQMEALGFTGADCEKATRFLEQALGWQASQKKKPEYYRANSVKAKRRQQLGGGSP